MTGRRFDVEYRNLFILELYTEENPVMNLIHTLRDSNWNITLVCSTFLQTCCQKLRKENVKTIFIEEAADIGRVDWSRADLILLPNGRFLPADYKNYFLRSVGDTPFGMGLFGISVVTAKNSSLRKPYFENKSLWSEASFVYVSDADFTGGGNTICNHVVSAGKKVLVIPFKLPLAARKTLNNAEPCVVISGKVQWKRRHYMTALILLLVSQKRLGRPLKVILNGKTIGIYGMLVALFAKLLTKFSAGLGVVTYDQLLHEDAYLNNLLKAQINLLPLSAMYADGKDCGAFYDAIEFNMINVCPTDHLTSIGSEHGCLAVGYDSIFGLPACITKVFASLPTLLDNSLRLSERYLELDFRGYLIAQLNILSQKN